MTVVESHHRDVSASVEVCRLALGGDVTTWQVHCFTCDWEDHYVIEAAAVAAGEDHSAIIHRWEDDRG